MPGENENQRNLSHHGIKEASGFVQRVNSSIGSEMPPGLTSMQALDASPHGSPTASSYSPEVRRAFNRAAPEKPRFQKREEPLCRSFKLCCKSFRYPASP